MASSVIFHGRNNQLPSYRGILSPGHWEWRERMVGIPELSGYRREVETSRDIYGNIIITTKDVPVYVNRWEKKLEKVWVED